MADKKLNAVSTAKDGAYIYAEDASGNQIKISKADLASVVAEQVSAIRNFGRNDLNGNSINNLDSLKVPGIYTFSRASDIKTGKPSVSNDDKMLLVIVTALDELTFHQASICGHEVFSREFYSDSWTAWG